MPENFDHAEMDKRLEEEFNQLTGKFKHYCYDWDGLPIDETCYGEFMACSCDWGEQQEEVDKLIEAARIKYNEESEAWQTRNPTQD